MFLQVQCDQFGILNGVDSAVHCLRARGYHTIIEPVPKAVEPILHQVLGRPKVKPRINCPIINTTSLKATNTQYAHSWMMLSKRITENRRLDTAAPAIRHRMTTRSRPRVFRPLTCFMNWSDSSAAILGRIGG